MPLLAALLGGAFSSLVGWLTQFVTKRVAIAGALGTFLVGGWIACEVALQAAWSAISWSAPEWMIGPLSVVAWLLPSNFNACLSACMGAMFARWVWDAQREWAVAVAQA